jgi:hypothetical protein
MPAAPPAGPPAAPIQPAAAAGAKAGGGSALKIILIVLAVLFVGSLLAAGSFVYSRYRRAAERVAQIAKDYGVDRGSGTNSGSAAPSFRIQSTPPAGDDCSALPWQTAAQTLGVAFERVQIGTGSGGSETCEFFVSAEERQRLAKAQMVKGFGQSQNTNEKEAVNGAQGVAQGWLNLALGSGLNAKITDPFLTLDLLRSGGRDKWSTLESVQNGAKGVSGGVFGMQPLEGVGDKAYLLPGGLNVAVLKGDALFNITFSFFPGPERAAAVARQVADRL